MKMYMAIAWDPCDDDEEQGCASSGPYETKERAAEMAKSWADDYEKSGVYAIDLKAVEVKVTIDDSPDEVVPKVDEVQRW
jgi:hypothetical protein